MHNEEGYVKTEAEMPRIARNDQKLGGGKEGSSLEPSERRT